jgi:hypothetical protein
MPFTSKNLDVPNRLVMNRIGVIEELTRVSLPVEIVIGIAMALQV